MPSIQQLMPLFRDELKARRSERQLDRWARANRRKAIVRGRRVQHRVKLALGPKGGSNGPQRRHGLLKYGLTIPQYEDMLVAQGGVCAICKRPEHRRVSHGDSVIRRLSIDHNHTTGVVRALLCQDCNAAVGLCRDDAEIAEAVAKYLRQHA